MTALRSSNVKDFLEIKDFMQRLNSVGTIPSNRSCIKSGGSAEVINIEIFLEASKLSADTYNTEPLTLVPNFGTYNPSSSRT